MATNFLYGGAMPNEKKLDVRGLSREEIHRNMVEGFGGVFYREHYPFGVHPSYRVAGDQTAMVYFGWVYLSPRGQFHPEVKADLTANWRPASREDQNWFCNNL